MKTKSPLIASALLLLACSATFAKDKEADKKAEKPGAEAVVGKGASDLYVGTYIRIPYIGTYGNVNPAATGTTHQITKSGDAYRLSGYNDDFVEKAKGVLEDMVPGVPGAARGALGTITAGQMSFSGEDKPMEVLKVKFAFDHFLLIKVDDPTRLEP